jgi:hypothetical protein
MNSEFGDEQKLQSEICNLRFGMEFAILRWTLDIGKRWRFRMETHLPFPLPSSASHLKT